MSIARHPSTFELEPNGPFSLDPLRQMNCGFLRGTRSCAAGEAVKVAFPRDGDFTVVGVTLREQAGRVEGKVVGTTDAGPIARQVARVLGLDQDGAAFANVLERDVVLRRVVTGHPGFRPVVAYSPYVMGGWAVLSQRLRMDQAAALQVKLAQATGDVVDIEGDVVASFPRPQSLLAMGGFPGISTEKWRRLETLAEAALGGELEVDRVIEAPYAEARARLMSLRGVGPWTADAILMRGSGLTDLLPISEPTLRSAIQLAYELEALPDDETVSRIAETWRPFRTWVSVLLISHDFEGAQRLVRGQTSGRARGGRNRATGIPLPRR